MNEEKNAQKNTQNIRISERLQNVVTESWHFMKHNRKARSIMFVNALIGAVSTLVLFFLQAKLPTAGLNEALLGPALFIVGLGAALGAKAKCVVYLEDENGRQRHVEVEDEWLTTNGIEEGSIWNENI